jgi:hypothetical protein
MMVTKKKRPRVRPVQRAAVVYESEGCFCCCWCAALVGMVASSQKGRVVMVVRWRRARRAVRRVVLLGGGGGVVSVLVLVGGVVLLLGGWDSAEEGEGVAGSVSSSLAWDAVCRRAVFNSARASVTRW